MRVSSYVEVISLSKSLCRHTVIDSVHVDDTKRFLALLELLLVMIPGEGL